MPNAIMRQAPRNRRFPTAKAVTYVLLAVYTLWLFVPLYTVFATSVTSVEQITSTTGFVWLPKITFTPYAQLFRDDAFMLTTGIPSILLGFINTMWMTLLSVTVGVVVSGLSAYAFSKMRFKGRETLFTVQIVLMTCPMGAFSIVSYIFYTMLGWVNTPLPIVVPGMFGSVSMVFFLRMFMDGIPNGLVEAAKIDGMGFFGIFFKIIFPLAKPAIIAQFIFGFVGGYNNYLGPLLYLSGNDYLITLQLVLSNVEKIFIGEGMENVHCAAAVVGMLPLIVIYCFVQRYFIEGIASGGVKE